MMPWFLRDPERLKRERAGIEELSRTAGWLIGAEWRLDGELCIDAVIRAHEHDYEVRVSFPSLYPDAPAIVRPRNMQSRISTHQYGGADGPLCLEWGPDNWHRDVTAVQMLESTYRLFDAENPMGENRPKIPVIAPSRHKLAVGQELRGEWARWYESTAFCAFLTAQPKLSIGEFKFSLRKTGETWTALVHEANSLEGNVWTDDRIPVTLPGAEAKELHIGVWFKTDLDKVTIGQPSKLVELQVMLAGMEGGKFLATDGSSPVGGFQQPIAGVLVNDQDGDSHLFIVLSGDTVAELKGVRSGTTATEVRCPESCDLNGKSVGIVGLGSAGSKIALSLARMGIRTFYLVDHDVFLPENIQRHALDWQSILQHKVDAMVGSIGRVAAGVKVDVCRLHIAGQESSASVSGALDRLAKCDLLIDATANPRVFNMLAAIARTFSRPMIWMEVFGGGMGGMVGRSRPGLDPTPQDMRSAYLRYCIDNPDPTARTTFEDYSTETEDGEVLVASDAEISIIAHHAARFVPDCFFAPERSRFPYSMYLIGLSKGWVFDAPFATIPISMASYTPDGWKTGKEAEIGSENAAFLAGLIERRNNAIADTAGDRVTAD